MIWVINFVYRGPDGSLNIFHGYHGNQQQEIYQIQKK